MAIYYVPGEAGWNDNGTLGSAAQLRLKLEKSYDAASNRSTLTITMQGRAPNYSGPFRLIENALLQLNGSTLFDGSSAPFNYNITFHGDNVWHDLTDGATGQTKSWTATVDHAADGTATAVLSVRARLFYSNSCYMTFYDLSGSQALDETRDFTLGISAGTGSTITVKRGGTTLPNGAALSYGDVLTIQFAAQSGYTLTAHTVNGESFPSGGTYTVTGSVFVAAAAARKTYTLIINAGKGSVITVLRGDTPLSSGAAITHGELLRFFFEAKSGYELLTHTVNSFPFPSIGSCTVDGPISAAATARRIGLLRLDTGSAIVKYRLLLDTGSAFVPLRIFLDRGDRFTEAGI